MSNRKTEGRPPLSVVCMLAYADYATDARIKNYIGALLRAGYEVDVIALGDRTTAQQGGANVLYIMRRIYSKRVIPFLVTQLWFFLLAFGILSFRCLYRRYGVVHVHNMPDYLVFAAIVPRLFGAKVILDVHDTMPESYATKAGLGLDHLAVRLLGWEERVSAWLADVVITTQELHKEALIEHGLPERKISIIMNVADPRVFCGRAPRPRGEGLTLGYHGTVAKRLGIDTILRAIAQVRDQCPGLRFKLVGDGEFMPEVRSLVRELRLDKVVSVCGWVPVECLSDELADVDVCVIGNRLEIEKRKNWILPVKMLEYAAMDIPSIAPRLRIITHYFDDSNALFYTPDSVGDLARRIQEVYDKPERLLQLRDGLRAFNERYNWQLMEERYLGMIERLSREQNASL